MKLNYFWLQYLHQVQATYPCAEFWTWVLWILQMEDLSTGWVSDLIQEEASQRAAASQTTTSTTWVSFAGNSPQTRAVCLHLLKLDTEMKRRCVICKDFFRIFFFFVQTFLVQVKFWRWKKPFQHYIELCKKNRTKMLT